jgi:hypothetical protein
MGSRSEKRGSWYGSARGLTSAAAELWLECQGFATIAERRSPQSEQATCCITITKTPTTVRCSPRRPRWYAPLSYEEVVLYLLLVQQRQRALLSPLSTSQHLRHRVSSGSQSDYVVLHAVTHLRQLFCQLHSLTQGDVCSEQTLQQQQGSAVPWAIKPASDQGYTSHISPENKDIPPCLLVQPQRTCPGKQSVESVREYSLGWTDRWCSIVSIINDANLLFY